MKKTSFLKIGGVPEHFNLPWIQAFQKQKFQGIGMETNWIFFPGGTGAMTQALHSDDLDVAILLTEGYLAAYQKGLKAKIIQCYIETPLQWGIYSCKKDLLQFDTTSIFAISRKGSGSHLMPLIHAETQGKKINESQFKVIHHLEDGITSLKNDCDYFYWEKWMTLPYVQGGHCHQIGEFSAPWSSFLIVATEKCIEEHSSSLQLLLDVIAEQVSSFVSSSNTPKEISKHFQLTEENAKIWLKEQRWNDNTNNIHKNEIVNAIEALERIGIDMKTININDLFAPWLTVMS